MRAILALAAAILLADACASPKTSEPPGGPPDLSVSPTYAFMHVGDRTQFAALVSGEWGPWAVQWRSSSSAIVSVDSSGNATAHSNGTAYVIARGTAPRVVLEDSATVTVQ